MTFSYVETRGGCDSHQAKPFIPQCISTHISERLLWTLLNQQRFPPSLPRMRPRCCLLAKAAQGSTPWWPQVSSVDDPHGLRGGALFSIIYSTHLLSTYYVPGYAPGTGPSGVRKIGCGSCPCGIYNLAGEKDANETIPKINMWLQIFSMIVREA